MDRFDLKWPSAEATFYTDGWRCRIVWRQTNTKTASRHGQGGIGGTIENNAQCLQRVAGSLDGAPYLLSALKARGHGRLAGEIEALAGETAAPAVEPVEPYRNPDRAAKKDKKVMRHTEAAPPGARPPEKAPPKNIPPKKLAAKPSLAAWLDLLPGSDAFDAASNRRAKAWFEIGELDAEALLLRPPPARGKQEWVLKRTWPGEKKRKAEYVVAAEFKGICSYLHEAGAGAELFESMLVACEGVEADALREAAKAWRAVMGKATH